jgi:hypothetical protein
MPKQTHSQAFELFFTPKFPYYFLVGALLLAIMGNALSDLVRSGLLQVRVELGPLELFMIFASATLLLCLLVWAAYIFGAIRQRALTPTYRVVDLPMPARARGLIAFVSLKQTDHLETALNYHSQTLEKVWLLATEDAVSTAEELKKRYELNSRDIQIVRLDNPYDLQSVRAQVETLYRSGLMGMPETDVIADFTGGTKPMTLGMIFACLSPTRRLEYVAAKYEDNKVSPLHLVEYGIDFSMFKGQFEHEVQKTGVPS